MNKLIKNVRTVAQNSPEDGNCFSSVEDCIGIREMKIGEIEKSGELNNFLKLMNKNKYKFQDSEKVFDNVVDLYMLSPKTHKVISSISSKYLISLFSLEYLSYLNKLINKKYGFETIHIKDLNDINKMRKIRGDFNKIQDEAVIKWISETCLDELSSIINNCKIDSFRQVNKLGSIISLMFSELNCDRELENIELYDVLYQFKRRLENYELDEKEHLLSIRYTEHKITKDGESTEYSLEIQVNKKHETAPDKFDIADIKNQRILLKILNKI